MQTKGNGKKEIIEINTGDSPDMIQICLNCDLPRCIEKCPKMLKAKGKNKTEKRGKPGVMLPYKDGYMSLAEASRQSGIHSRTLKYRLKILGLSLEQAIQMGKPVYRKRKEKTK